MFRVRDATGAYRTITRLRVRDGSITRLIRTVKVMDANGVTLRTVASLAPPLSLSINPSTVSGSVNTALPTPVTTSATTATPSGGIGPYSYAWAVEQPDYGVVTIGAPTNATTTFTHTRTNLGDLVFALATCTVTDGLGQTASANVTARFTNTNHS